MVTAVGSSELGVDDPLASSKLPTPNPTSRIASAPFKARAPSQGHRRYSAATPSGRPPHAPHPASTARRRGDRRRGRGPPRDRALPSPAPRRVPTPSSPRHGSGAPRPRSPAPIASLLGTPRGVS